MNKIASQFRRIFADDGQGDKDFGAQEERLREAQKYLQDATDGLKKAAGILSDLIKSRA